jgi:hypothetical protein
METRSTSSANAKPSKLKLKKPTRATRSNLVAPPIAPADATEVKETTTIHSFRSRLKKFVLPPADRDDGKPDSINKRDVAANAPPAVDSVGNDGVVACPAAAGNLSKADGRVEKDADTTTVGRLSVAGVVSTGATGAGASDGRVAKAAVVVAPVTDATDGKVDADATDGKIDANATDGKVGKAGVVPPGDGKVAIDLKDRKLAAISIIPKVSEVMKDGDVYEPDWFNFPGREEVEKVLPKMYWAKPPNPGKDAPLINLRYHIDKLEEEQQALAQGDAAMAADIFF